MKNVFAVFFPTRKLNDNFFLVPFKQAFTFKVKETHTHAHTH